MSCIFPKQNAVPPVCAGRQRIGYDHKKECLILRGGQQKGSGLHLLPLEDMLVELLLQALIGQVDAQLLKAVLLEALKPVDVQDANGAL